MSVMKATSPRPLLRSGRERFCPQEKPAQARACLKVRNIMSLSLAPSRPNSYVALSYVSREYVCENIYSMNFDGCSLC